MTSVSVSIFGAKCFLFFLGITRGAETRPPLRELPWPGQPRTGFPLPEICARLEPAAAGGHLSLSEEKFVAGKFRNSEGLIQGLHCPERCPISAESGHLGLFYVLECTFQSLGLRRVASGWRFRKPLFYPSSSVSSLHLR